jgi:hypothetical protein
LWNWQGNRLACLQNTWRHKIWFQKVSWLNFSITTLLLATNTWFNQSFICRRMMRLWWQFSVRPVLIRRQTSTKVSKYLMNRFSRSFATTCSSGLRGE